METHKTVEPKFARTLKLLNYHLRTNASINSEDDDKEEEVI